ncbi:MAG: hypothetical protein JWO41_334 [Candidatus Saccharibacteria bacterium]|nr:hypothetical protein [Candidatus Saccharibacteria bacterium]
MTIAKIKSDIGKYVQNKTWYWYVPGWFVGLYLFFEILQFNPNKQSSLLIMPAQSFDFFLHEMAHTVTAFLPAVITASAGSLSEILLGSLLVFGAFKTRGYFASMICSLWLMLACQSAGIYMADARAQKLNLVSLGGALSGSDTATHDWHFVFGRLHILGLDTLIGNTVRGIGVCAGLFGLSFAAWLIYKMKITKN